MTTSKYLKKISDSSKKIFIAAVVTVMASCLSGCSATQNVIAEGNYFERVMRSITVSGDMQYTSMNIDIPFAYGDIPPHPDDPGSGTRKVDLKSGHYSSLGLGVDFSPLPFDTIENIKLGYKGVFPSGANQTRKGLSHMEWYEFGASAGTYSRVNLPSAIHSLTASWRQPISRTNHSDSFVEVGLSYDLWQVKVQGGWDRYYNEETMLEDKMTSDTLNLFVRAGINIYQNTAIGFFWKPERIKGNTPRGDVDIKGNTYGLQVIIRF